MSALEGSDWFENEIVAGLPSFFGPLLESVAVGATLFTVTEVVYSVNPLSLSMIRARTVCVLGPSANVHDVDAPVAEFANVAVASEPLSQAYA